MILLMTIDGLHWTALDAAMREKRLPTAAALANAGSIARLRPDVPTGGCACWASLATGTPPLDHGLVCPVEAWAGGLRPATRASWRRAPLWQVLADQGHRTASIAFPFAGPGDSWDGVHVDHRILDMSGLDWDDWPLPLGVGPDRIREALRSARVHATDVPPAMLAPFATGGALDGAREAAVMGELARASTLFGIVDVVADAAQPAFLAVQLDWPARFAAALGETGPDALPPPFWTLLDAAFSKLADLAGSGSTIILASPGTAGHSGFLLVREPNGPARPAVIGTASVLDIAPLVLSRFGCGMPPRSKVIASTEARTVNSADRQRVESFGHELPGPPASWPAPRLIAEAELLLANDLGAAGAKAREALALAPRSERALALAGLVAFARGDLESLEQFADGMAETAPGHLWTAMLQAGCHVLRKDARQAAPLLRRVEAEGNADDRLRAAAAWLMLNRGSDAERLFESILAEQPDSIPALLGLASRKARRPFDAEQLLRRVLAIDPAHPEARSALIELLQASGRAREADAMRQSQA